jgi:hypothetical protein
LIESKKEEQKEKRKKEDKMVKRVKCRLGKTGQW